MSRTDVPPPPRPVEMARPIPLLFAPVLITAVLGGLAIVGAELLEDAALITPEALGQAIVRRGNFPAELTDAFGWVLHMGASFLYTALFAVAAWTLFGALDPRVRLTAALGLAALLGVVATLVAPIATETAVSVLAGRGMPDQMPPLAPLAGQSLWNHMLFFAIAWLGTVLVLDRG